MSLGGFQVDDPVTLGGKLNRKVAHVLTFENAINIRNRSPSAAGMARNQP